MKEIATFQQFGDLEAAFDDWFNDTFLPEFKRHGGRVSEPTPREAMLQRSVMHEVTDALTWSNELQPDAEDFENQAMALATAQMTVAEAKGKCHRFIKTHKALKRLSESAEKKLSCLQSLLRG